MSTTTVTEEELVTGDRHYYTALPASEQRNLHSTRKCRDATSSPPISYPVFDELPKATIVSVSRPDAADFTPLLFSYVIELQYKEFKWRLQKKASQVLSLHLSLKKRAIIDEIIQKQELVKEWLHYIGIGDNVTPVQDDEDFDDEGLRIQRYGSSRHRYVPSRAALPIISLSFGGNHTLADKAKDAMQNYLNHFLCELDIVNSHEVCKFLEVSSLSFSREYGPKLKEGYVMINHLPSIQREDSDRQCLPCQLFGFCNRSWQKVWAVLRPGFLVFIEDPLSNKPLDIIIFDMLPTSSEGGEGKAHLASVEHGHLHYTFTISCRNRSISLRVSNGNKVKDWVSSINEAAERPIDGWCCPHQFGSFAPQRGLSQDDGQAQWFVDGRSAFEAIASSIERAKSEIFITGWWLCPELYLRRPFLDQSSSRLDALLEAKAKEGVQIYVLLYKEVSIALKINSSYSKKRLLSIHENVKVLRHPDHLQAGIFYWSHHEKIVVVDNQTCFIGGLDLCFGRYDTMEHEVGDFPAKVWPGKDYYNPRESEPNSWQDMMKDELDRQVHPRMPWHEVHCALWGSPCRDIARHFVQRWNFAKREKAPNQQAIPLLMPHHQPQHRVLPHYMGKSREMDIPSDGSRRADRSLTEQDSFSSESPSQDLPLLLPRDSQGVYGSSPDILKPVHEDHIHLDQKSKSWSFTPWLGETQLAKQDLPTNNMVHPHGQQISSLNGNSQEEEEHSSLQDAVKWWECQQRECQDDYVESREIPEVGPRISCHFQVIRSASRWSAGTNQAEDSIHKAYCSLIENADHFVYIENQFFVSGLEGDSTIQNRVLEALYRRILQAHKENKCFRAIIVIPLVPGFQGGIDDRGAATVRALMHWQYRTICRGENSILRRLNKVLDGKADRYISFYGLRKYGLLFEGGPIVTSQIYVHSKVMIVDDRISLIGSSNINDRSLLGFRDSEIAIVIEDKELIESSMNEKPWKAGKFSFSLRISLWLEHLGLNIGQIREICDPVSNKSYTKMWMEAAETNTKIYQDVFSCVPNDDIHTRWALRRKMSQLKDKIGHTTIDFGVAPQTVETRGDDGETNAVLPMELLKLIKGNIVCFPLEFMREEDLRPMFHEGEFYTGPEVFH